MGRKDVHREACSGEESPLATRQDEEKEGLSE